MIYECISRHRRVIHSMIYQTCGLDKKSRIKMIRLFWSKWWDSNPRPRGPEPRALSTALHLDITIIIQHLLQKLQQFYQICPNRLHSLRLDGKIFPLTVCVFQQSAQTYGLLPWQNWRNLYQNIVASNCAERR